MPRNTVNASRDQPLKPTSARVAGGPLCVYTAWQTVLERCLNPYLPCVDNEGNESTTRTLPCVVGTKLLPLVRRSPRELGPCSGLARGCSPACCRRVRPLAQRMSLGRYLNALGMTTCESQKSNESRCELGVLAFSFSTFHFFFTQSLSRTMPDVTAMDHTATTSRFVH